MASVVLHFNEIERLGYGVESSLAHYFRLRTSPPDSADPVSSSGDETTVPKTALGAGTGLLRSAYGFVLPNSFSFLMRNGDSHDFYCVSESDCETWVTRLSQAFKPFGIGGIPDR